MKPTSPKIALKPYLEAVKAHCEKLSREELAETVLQLAQEATVGERKGFLDKIESIMPQASLRDGKKQEKRPEGKLFDQIEALREEIQERIESIEDGSYYEDMDYYDDEPDYITETQMDELEEIFLEVGNLFLNSQLEAAGWLYGTLFDLLDETEDPESFFSSGRTDIREARARYSRCVYETADVITRADEVFEAMDINALVSQSRLKLSEEKYPMLQDLADARPGELKEWDLFLPEWEKKLSACNTIRCAVLRMEAVWLMQGTEGVARLARKWKAEQPCGYLYWIQALAEQENWQEVLSTCQEALEILPKNSFREQVSEYFMQAGEELGEDRYLLQGKRERFLSSPDEKNLLSLLEDAGGQDARSDELDTILGYPGKQRRSEVFEKNLHARILLMAGRLDEAYEQGKDEESLGWSYGNAGILFSSILSVVTGNSEKALIIRLLLKEYASCPYSWHSESEKAYREILKGLGLVSLSEAEKKKYLEWAEKIGCARVEFILSEKRRNSYNRAAQTLGALGECYVLLGQDKKARTLSDEFYNVRFSRFNAFRREVKYVFKNSELLGSLGIV